MTYFTKDRKPMAGVMLAGASAFAAQHCLQPVIGAIGETFGLAPAAASLAVSAAMIGMALMALVLSALAQYLPHRRSVIGALFAAGLLTLTVGMVPSFGIVCALRFLTGAILGLVPVLIISFVEEAFAADRAAVLISFYVCGTTMGGMLGRFLASWLTDLFGWQEMTAILGVSFLALAAAVAWLLPQSGGKGRARGNALAGLSALLTPAHRLVWCLYLIAFCGMGSFYTLYNYISYVLIAPPYNFSRTAIGFLFFVQFFGTLGSLCAGQLGKRHVLPAGVVGIGAFLLIAGSLLSLGGAVLMKMGGIAVVTFGLFLLHATAGGWCARMVPAYKESAVAVYMFAYYCGASVMGSAGGLCYTYWGWAGVAYMGAASGAFAFAALLLLSHGTVRMPSLTHAASHG